MNEIITLLVESAFGQRTRESHQSVVVTSVSRPNNGPAVANQFRSARARATKNHGMVDMLCQGGRSENGPSVNPRHPLKLA